MKKKKLGDPLDMASILKISANELKAFAAPLEAPTRIELGIVVLDRKTFKPYSGALYSAGAKVYKSEGVARAATAKNRKSYIYVTAYAEIPAGLN